MKVQIVRNIDSGQSLYFDAKTPYEAMSKLKYFLGLKNKSDEECKINKTESGNFLYLVFDKETYCVRN